ncbi:MAG: T9SS type A sorting domain-containing protein [Bacteroidales bacterium]|nr:T9SS type A sorting domain-containing protein [Bacteroidales bacterium]
MKYLYTFFIFCALSTSVLAQLTKPGDIIEWGNHSTALDSIIVETYYISDADDATDEDGGHLPEGSVTYRVFADLKPGYSLISVFGVHGGDGSSVGHELLFGTNSGFFNNADRGVTMGSGISSTSLNKNTVALDSWLTINYASKTHLGVLKSDDPDGSIIGGENNDGGSEEIEGGLLKNNDERAGIPLTLADGLIEGTSNPLNNVGFEDLETYFLDANTEGGSILSTYTGIYHQVGNGVKGPTPENRILIGQFTVTGNDSLFLKLNLQMSIDSSLINSSNSSISEIRYVHATTLADTTDPVDSKNVFFYERPDLLVIKKTVPEKTINSVNSLSDRNKISLFPNPASDFVNIKISENNVKECTINISDVSGHVVLHHQTESFNGFKSEIIDISSLPKGFYMVNITVDGKSVVKRLVKP